MYDASQPGNYLYIHFYQQNRDYVMAAVSRLQAQGLVCVLGEDDPSAREGASKQSRMAAAAAVVSFLSAQAQLSSSWRRELLQALSLAKELVLVPLGQVAVTPVLQQIFSRLTVCPLLEAQREQWASQMARLPSLRPALGQPQSGQILAWPATTSMTPDAEPSLFLRNLENQASYPCLYPSFILGRSQQKADYVFAKKNISREQVSLTYRQKSWWLTALSEHTPSFLNGSMVQQGKAYPLTVGDEISFAGERLRLEVSPAKSQATSPAAFLQVEACADPQLASGRRISVSPLPFTLGRSASCQLQIKVKTVSSHHGEISREAENYYYRDLGSTNGSRLNGLELEAHKAYLLKNQDLLQLHEESFRFQLA